MLPALPIDKDGWPERTQFAWPILGGCDFSYFDRALLLHAGTSLNLTKNTAQRLLDYLCEKTVQEARVLYEEIQEENIASRVFVASLPRPNTDGCSLFKDFPSNWCH